MHIEAIKIENFRLLKDCQIDVRKETTLLVGKNNTGKTSFAVLLEKFLVKPDSFSYSDFPLALRNELKGINQDFDPVQHAIRMVFRIYYNEADDLSVLSEFMLDLDPERRHANILFECTVDKDKLLRALPEKKNERDRFIENNLGERFLTTRVYAFDDHEYEGDEPYYLTMRDQLEEKDRRFVSTLCNLQVIHARRNVASSEDTGRGAKPLSAISTKFFKKLEGFSRSADGKVEAVTEAESESMVKLRTMLADIDNQLESQYDEVFGEFLKNSRDFLELGDLKVVSNLQSQALIESSSQVIYGNRDESLPEQFSGLGYLNVLYLLLQIELCRDDFKRTGAPLNILLMEEPEAHTHPQMQYVFADKINALVVDISNLQTLMTTHSSHIVSKSNFEDIRYLSASAATKTVVIKNFHDDLLAIYQELGDDGAKLFQFLKQYLTINSAELFFANKAIFIEGTTERILLPWFIEKRDKDSGHDKAGGGLSSQNITVLEVGANARAFAPFLELIDVPTLIITDIDTTVAVKDEKTGKTRFRACKVSESTHTSNDTLKHFLSAPDDIHSDAYKEWHNNLLKGALTQEDSKVRIAHQTEENGYHARSFEDAFIALNAKSVSDRKNLLVGLKKKELLDDLEKPDYFTLTQNVLDKKSDFAGSILFSALVEGQDWRVPNYIMEGLAWVQKQ